METLDNGRYKHVWKVGIIAATIMAVLLFLVSEEISIRSGINEDTEDAAALGGIWEYRWEGEPGTGTILLPGKVSGGGPYKILYLSNQIREVQPGKDTLFFRTSQQNVRILLNGSVIYQYGFKNEWNKKSPPGSTWHFVQLPQINGESRIELLLMSPYRQFSGLAGEIRVGSKSSHLQSIFKKYIVSMFIGGVLLLLGVLLILLHFFANFRKVKFHGALNLGLFSVLSGVWIVSESKFIQLLIDRPVLILYLACVSIFLMPVPLLMFVGDAYQLRKNKILGILAFSITVAFIMGTAVHISGILSYLQLVPLFHILDLMCILVMLYVCLKELLSGNKRIRIFLAGCMFLSAFSVMDLFGFYFSKIPALNTQRFTQYGMLIFIFLMTCSLAQVLFEMYDRQAHVEVYEIMAYTDILTGMKNRAAFEKRIAELEKDLDASNAISIIVLDLNNLKQTNDNLGHKAGDMLLSITAQLIDRHLGFLGETYRMGGDEFVVVACGRPPEEIRRAIDLFSQEIFEYNRSQNEVVVSIAVGSSCFEKGKDNNLHSVFARADREMYDCKYEQKRDLKSVPV